MPTYLTAPLPSLSGTFDGKIALPSWLMACDNSRSTASFSNTFTTIAGSVVIQPLRKR